MERDAARPSISVLMSVRSGPDRQALAAAVRSILEQTDGDFELLLYHDGTDPDTQALLRGMAGRDRRIRCLGGSQNRGLGAALNACAAQARGEFLARMDDDDIALPERFALQKAFLRAHPEAAFCGSAAYLFDLEGVWGLRRMPERPETGDFLRFSPYIHPSVMFRRSVLTDGEGYPEGREALLYEDYALFMGLHRQGIRGANLPEPLLLYRENPGTYRKRSFAVRLRGVRLRFRHFRAMGALWPLGWVQALRPALAGLLPAGWIARYKRRESGGEVFDEERAAQLLQRYLKEPAA